MNNAIKPDHYRKGRQYQPWDVAKDWDIVTVMDLADKTEKEFEIGQLQRVRRRKQHEGQ